VDYYNRLRSDIDPETQAGVLEAYVRGDVTREICNRYGIASSTLYKILRDHNIVPGNRKKSVKSKALQESDRVHQLQKAGVTISELARMYEVSDTTIRNILK
jgi:transposase-like protein